MTGPRLLVIGASSRVGRLLSPAWKRHAEGRVSEQFRQDCGEDSLLWPDLSDSRPLQVHVERRGCPDAILVLAGVTGGGAEALEMNVTVARNTIAAARLIGTPRVFLASSSAVYGLDRGGAFTEQDSPAPANPYGASKLRMEAVEGGMGGPSITRLRIGNVAGADSLLTAAATASRDAPLTLDRYGNGRGPRRSYISPDGFVRAILSLMDATDSPPILNFAAPQPVEMTDLLDAAEVPWVWKPAGEARAQSIVLDVGRLAGLHRFAPQDSTAEHLTAPLRQARILS